MSNSGKQQEAPAVISIFHLKDFDEALDRMWRSGAERKKKAEKVFVVLGRLSKGLEAFRELQVTDHGESRIKSCVKYELGGGYRLITIHRDKTITLCYVGNHADCDHWLETNSGLVITRNDQNTLERGFRTNHGATQTMIRREPVPSTALLLDHLDEDKVNDLLTGVPPLVIRKIVSLGGITLPADVSSICNGIGDDAKRVLVQDVLMLLLNGDARGAEQRLELESGQSEEVQDLSREEILEIADGDGVRRVAVGSKAHEEWLARFATEAPFSDWLLFMHPEQEKVASEDFDGSAQLSGVSGSGKTCVAVKRAARLVETNVNTRVLLVTLNRSLASLIRNLIREAVPDEAVRARIDVFSFFELCQKYLKTLEARGDRIYLDETWKLGEHIDEIFREYYRCWHNNTDAKSLIPVHMSLTAQGINAEAYLREEFDWIRSALAEKDREQYEEIARAGRRYRLQQKWRKRVLTALQGWERKMRAVGATDYLGLTTSLSRYLDKLTSEYNHIIVDEGQDFGTTELQILRRLVQPGPNDIFICGDIAQHVLPKHRNLTEAGIDISSRRRQITRNYRNSRQILEAAYRVLRENLDEELLAASDLEILDPKYANRSSPEPFVLRASSFEEEFAFARRLVADHFESKPGDRCCIAIAGFTLKEISVFAKALDLPVLDGAKDPGDSFLVLSDLEQTKGYEFGVMIVINCLEGILPPADSPAEEAFRHGCRLYVAMTRAKNELYLSYHNQPSRWLSNARDALSFDDWSWI
jgi:superfamily I DNA/RNA helicase